MNDSKQRKLKRYYCQYGLVEPLAGDQIIGRPVYDANEADVVIAEYAAREQRVRDALQALVDYEDKQPYATDYERCHAIMDYCRAILNEVIKD